VAMGMILVAVVWIQFSHKLAVGRAGGQAVVKNDDRSSTARPTALPPQTEEATS